ncbi:hypothetical protein GQR58_022127 [Nymphon striatum]|nr:hypothetical protein GQR58_022127 [Nymphon striatum]
MKFSAIQHPDISIDITSESILLTSTGKVTFKENECSDLQRCQSDASSVNKQADTTDQQALPYAFESLQACTDGQNQDNNKLSLPPSGGARRKSVTWAVTIPRRYSVRTNNENYLNAELPPSDPLEMKHIFNLGQELKKAVSYNGQLMSNDMYRNRIGTLLNAVINAMIENSIDFRMKLSDVIRKEILQEVERKIRLDEQYQQLRRLKEPVFQVSPDSSEYFRVDVSARGFLQRIQRAFVDVRVFYYFTVSFEIFSHPTCLTEFHSVFSSLLQYKSFQVDAERMELFGAEEQCICCDNEDQIASLDFCYGYRLGYHPKVSASRRNSCSTCKSTPVSNERIDCKKLWQWAYLKMACELKLKKLTECNQMGELAYHPAKHVITTIYNQLLERRLVLQGLRRSNLGLTGDNRGLELPTKSKTFLIL